MTGGNVVPEISPVSEEDFRNAMVEGLARAQRRTSVKVLAFLMDLTVKQLGNVFKGGTTHPKRLWDALFACPTALDNVADLYGKCLVDKADAEASKVGTLPIATLLAKVAEAESPHSPSGVEKTTHELLAMEEEIRKVHCLTGGWIERINAVRTPPRAVSG